MSAIEFPIRFFIIIFISKLEYKSEVITKIKSIIKIKMAAEAKRVDIRKYVLQRLEKKIAA